METRQETQIFNGQIDVGPREYKVHKFQLEDARATDAKIKGHFQVLDNAGLIDFGITNCPTQQEQRQGCIIYYNFSINDVDSATVEEPLSQIQNLQNGPLYLTFDNIESDFRKKILLDVDLEYSTE